jgi:hypothetical protein
MHFAALPDRVWEAARALFRCVTSELEIRWNLRIYRQMSEMPEE